MPRSYDPVGAMGGLFAPAWIYGDPTAMAAATAWNERNRRYAPAPDPSTWAPPGGAGKSISGAVAPGSSDMRDQLAASLMEQQRYYPESGGATSTTGVPGGGYPLDPNLDPNPHTTPIVDVPPPPDEPVTAQPSTPAPQTTQTDPFSDMTGVTAPSQGQVAYGGQLAAPGTALGRGGIGSDRDTVQNAPPVDQTTQPGITLGNSARGGSFMSGRGSPVEIADPNVNVTPNETISAPPANQGIPGSIAPVPSLDPNGFMTGIPGAPQAPQAPQAPTAPGTQSSTPAGRGGIGSDRDAQVAMATIGQNPNAPVSAQQIALQDVVPLGFIDVTGNQNVVNTEPGARLGLQIQGMLNSLTPIVGQAPTFGMNLDNAPDLGIGGPAGGYGYQGGFDAPDAPTGFGGEGMGYGGGGFGGFEGGGFDSPAATAGVAAAQGEAPAASGIGGLSSGQIGGMTGVSTDVGGMTGGTAPSAGFAPDAGTLGGYGSDAW